MFRKMHLLPGSEACAWFRGVYFQEMAGVFSVASFALCSSLTGHSYLLGAPCLCDPVSSW